MAGRGEAVVNKRIRRKKEKQARLQREFWERYFYESGAAADLSKFMLVKCQGWWMGLDLAVGESRGV